MTASMDACTPMGPSLPARPLKAYKLCALPSRLPAPLVLLAALLLAPLLLLPLLLLPLLLLLRSRSTNTW